MSLHSQKPPHHILVPWVIWFAILQGLIILQVFAAGGLPQGPDKGNPPLHILAISFSGFFFSFIVRWAVVPKVKKHETMMTVMILGLALAECTGLLGMFFIDSDFPGAKMVAFFCAIIGIVQFAPTYFPKNDEPRS